MPTNSLLHLAVVVCGFIAGWLFFQNGVRKDDPGKDLIRTVAGAVLCFAPFVWNLMLGPSASTEYSLVLLCVTGACSFLVSQCLQTQSKYVKDPACITPVSVLTILLPIVAVVAGVGLVLYSERHPQTPMQAEKAISKK